MSEKIGRKKFLKSTLAVGGAVTLGACGDDKTDSTSSGGAGSGGTAGAGTGGTMAGGGGTAGAASTLMCMTAMDGDHTHPVTIPGSDVERALQDEPYILEDGGTGHTHELYLSAYDFLDLQFGGSAIVPSTDDFDHSHNCTITCSDE
jgi:hypothetical protein